MTEFSEDLSKKYTGKEALKRRVECRIKHTLSDIPYYDRGVDISEFTYGSKSLSLQQALRDFSPMVTIDNVNSRVQVYDVVINVDNIL